MVKASCTTYDTFRATCRTLENWCVSAEEPIPQPLLFVSQPGIFVVMQVFEPCGIVAALELDAMPEVFPTDCPAAIEVHGLTVRGGLKGHPSE